MTNDQPSRCYPHSPAKNLPGMSDTLIEGANKQRFLFDYFIFGVQIQADQMLLLVIFHVFHQSKGQVHTRPHLANFWL